MIPECRADTESPVFVLIMMQVMITPLASGPTERRSPCMNGIVDRTIHQVAKLKKGKNAKALSCIKRYIKPKIVPEIRILGNGGTNNRVLSRG